MWYLNLMAIILRFCLENGNLMLFRPQTRIAWNRTSLSHSGHDLSYRCIYLSAASCLDGKTTIGAFSPAPSSSPLLRDLGPVLGRCGPKGLGTHPLQVGIPPIYRLSAVVALGAVTGGFLFVSRRSPSCRTVFCLLSPSSLAHEHHGITQSGFVWFISC